MVASSRELLAVVALESDKDKLAFGVPLFTAHDDQEQEEISTQLARMFQADAKRLSNGLMLIIRVPRA